MSLNAAVGFDKGVHQTVQGGAYAALNGNDDDPTGMEDAIGASHHTRGSDGMEERGSTFKPAGLGQAGYFSSVANLSNAILGAGMLALPSAFANSGTIVCLVLLLVSAAGNAFTGHLLSVVGREIGHGSATFYEIAEQAMPEGTVWVVDAALIANCFGLCTSYLIVVGELMPSVFTSGPGTSRVLWVCCGLAFVTPLSFAPTLDALKFTSAMGMAFVCYLTCAVVYLYVGGIEVCQDDEQVLHCGGEVVQVVGDMSILQSVSIITFAYAMHAQLLGVSNEVANYTQPKMDCIINASIGLCCVVYCTIGLLGYLAFGDQVESNLLVSYRENGVVGAARICITLLVCVSYPLMVKPMRDSALSLMAQVIKNG
mmetsp:Transcript_40457/g.108334  ORF Transcript_40457/g.108334 Transcript_40457/m.108334 type:complete len:370 (-) Transcript_40457:295-1404(-)